MQPQLQLLTPEMISQVLDEAFDLLLHHGIKVLSDRARDLLLAAGAQAGNEDVIYLPEAVVRKACETAPKEFFLSDRAGQPAIHYGGNSVHFDPGSSGVNILDSATLQNHPAVTQDLVKLIQLTETLSEYDAQSTAVVCSDVPKGIGDLYRLYLVLLFSAKPIVTGAFALHTGKLMFEMLAIYRSGLGGLADNPLAVFDVCPTPPLIWSKFGGESLIDLAQAQVPAQIVSMPLAGAGAPVTLLGSIVQHAAETLSGITIHQLAGPGAPIVWGGAPAIFDMRQGTTPMGAVETAMLDIGYAQVGKSLGFPTHTYLGASDAKLVDAQAGLESGITAVLGALGGINMISGAGMLDFLATQSPEKLVVDAEAIRMAKRLLQGIHPLTETYALELFTGIGFKADFLKQKATRQLFAKEQSLPSPVIDRMSIRAWQQNGSLDTMQRARRRVDELLAVYTRPEADPAIEAELRRMVSSLARQEGMDQLPV